MKQKYIVLVDHDAGKLAIQEYAELDKEMLSLLCEETYAIDGIKQAMDSGRNALIQAIRTYNMYPPGLYTERIADAIVGLFQPDANTSAELFFEERDMFEPPEEEASDASEGSGKASDMEVDDLLEDGIEDDDFAEKGIIKNLKKKLTPSDEEAGLENA